MHAERHPLAAATHKALQHRHYQLEMPLTDLQPMSTRSMGANSHVERGGGTAGAGIEPRLRGGQRGMHEQPGGNTH